MRIAMLVAAVVAAALCVATPAFASAPVVSAFYYPWFGSPEDGGYDHWAQNGHAPPVDIASNYYPAYGPYSSSNAAVIATQLSEVLRAGIDELAVSWWGRGSAEDKVLPDILAGATGTAARRTPPVCSARRRSGRATTPGGRSAMRTSSCAGTARPTMRCGTQPSLPAPTASRSRRSTSGRRGRRSSRRSRSASASTATSPTTARGGCTGQPRRTPTSTAPPTGRTSSARPQRSPGPDRRDNAEAPGGRRRRTRRQSRHVLIVGAER